MPKKSQQWIIKEGIFSQHCAIVHQSTSNFLLFWAAFLYAPFFVLAMVKVKNIHAEAGDFETFEKQPTLSIIINCFSAGLESSSLCACHRIIVNSLKIGVKNCRKHPGSGQDLWNTGFREIKGRKTQEMCWHVVLLCCSWRCTDFGTVQRQSAPDWPVGILFLP